MNKNNASKQPETNGTRGHIINVARQLFSQHSYAAVSMDDIAQELSITKAALYYHFPSKEEIYHNVIDQIEYLLKRPVEEALQEKTPEKRLEALFKNCLENGYQEVNLMRSIILAYAAGDKNIAQRVTKILKDNSQFFYEEVKQIRKKSSQLKNTDDQSVSKLIVALLYGLLLDNTFLNRKANSKKMANLVLAILKGE